jgi:ATP-dependent DNA helicase RecQ
MMRAYAEGHDCRRRFLLIYFGEEVEQACGCCDICEADISSETSEPQGPFRLNSWVQHTEWGRGLSTYYEGDKVTVMFEAVGEKRLAVDFVLTHGRLKALEP